jgi:replication factor C small subunit
MNEIEQYMWSEKHRPKTVEDCILPKEIKTCLLNYVREGEVPHLIFYGVSGVGKTTAAKALCNQIGIDYLFINGSDETGIDTFRNKVKNFASTVSFNRKKKVILIDEGDGLNINSTQPAMRSAMDEFSKNCTFIITCNNPNLISPHLMSRFTKLEFRIPKEEKIAVMSQFLSSTFKILDAENVTYDKKAVAELVKKNYPDFRQTILELQRYHNSTETGEIDIGILRQSNGKVQDLVVAMRGKDFDAIRAWVTENCYDMRSGVYRSIYDVIYPLLDKSSVANAVLIIARYQYQAAFAADLELNLTACILEIITECNFKS